jgi:hypothetical protein
MCENMFDLAKLGDGRGYNPTVMVGDKTKQNNNKQKLGRNRGIPKTQLGFSLDQYIIKINRRFT